MRNPNLIPVVITDIRGRTTTVHRRSDKSGASKASLSEQAIISPDSSAEYERNKPKGQKAYRAMGLSGYGGVTVKTLTCIAMLDEPLLDRIVERCQGDGIEQKLWKLNFRYRDSFNAKNPGINPRVLEQYREALELYPMALRLLDLRNKLDPNSIGSVQEAVDTYVHSTERRTEHLGLEFDAQTMKAVMVSAAIKPFYADEDREELCETVDFVAQNMDAVIDKLPLLLARGDRNAGLLKELLASDNDALADGIL